MVYLLGSEIGAGGRHLSGLKIKHFENYFMRRWFLNFKITSVPSILTSEGCKGTTHFGHTFGLASKNTLNPTSA